MIKAAASDPLIDLLKAGLDGVGPLGLAVSGGGDSMALLHLCAKAGIPAEVATVDHRLRPEAAEEARMVAGIARKLGMRHETLVWDGAAAQGNLPDAARSARRRLLADWAMRRGLAAVVLAHTQDDVAETFLMRLARGAGVDGLSAMAREFQTEGMRFLRPLLGVSRGALRGWLRLNHVTWVEDPTNEDAHYERTRARAVLKALAPLGLTAPRLAEVAGHLAEARVALEAATESLLGEVAEVAGQGLALRLRPEVLFAAPDDLQRRALVAMLLWFAPGPYAPRGEQVARLAARLRAGQPAQLAGTRFFHKGGEIWACREARDDVSRWRVDGDLPTGLTLRVLGAEGLAQVPDWRKTGLPRAVLLAAPGLWRGDGLVSAPHAGRSAGFRVELAGPSHPKAARILSH